MMKKLTAAMVGAVACAAVPSTGIADCGTVTVTEMNWASASVATAISAFLMTEGYGCEVTTVPSSTVPAMASIAETGSPDVAIEVWANTAPAYFDLKDQGKLVELADVLSDGGVEAWWIPNYLAEAHPELTTIDGVLANPSLVGGRFHNCPDGWACRIVNDSLIPAFDLEGHGLEVFNHGSGETLATSIAAAFEDRAPWFGYYWAPTSVLGKYPMVKVDIGPYVPETHSCNANPECEDVGKSAYPTSLVVTAATTAFVEREPEVADLMSKVSFSNERMGGLLAWQEENSASAAETAVHYLTSHPDEWSAWLNDAARERLSALLP